ncbi:Leucine-rich repeat - like 10 [Theobroma cacao]|nr:Leucine-rich repeat - like 10 [Theobroma cacao]
MVKMKESLHTILFERALASMTRSIPVYSILNSQPSLLRLLGEDIKVMLLVVGTIPLEISQLSKLLSLDISGNPLIFEGHVFEKLLGNLTQLRDLDLSAIDMSLVAPSSFLNMSSFIRTLVLESNGLRGKFPEDVLRLPYLQNGLSRLLRLHLDHNFLSGRVPNWLFTLPTLVDLDLSYNGLTGPIDPFEKVAPLEIVKLQNNEIHGPIPSSVFKLFKRLEFLYLSHNFPLSLSDNSNVSLVLPNLSFLSLSSCNITELSNFLTTQESLLRLDLSNNTIEGRISKQTTTWGKKLNYLDLSKNFLTGLEYYPQNIVILNLGSNLLEGPLLVPPSSTKVFLVSKNKLTGEIPSAICNLMSISILDLSNNNLSGTIPECLCSGETMLGLYILDLHMNKFHGNIPDSFVAGNELQTLNLQNNDFDGPFPKSLVNCHDLEVLNLGNNRINDTFPHWLGTLTQLKVIILRSNYFHGQILLSEAESNFSVLRILDLSHNEFSGFLPTAFFKSFKGMMNLSNVDMKYMENPNGYHHFSMFVTMKGLDIEVERVLTVFTAVDFSSNKFQGKIPEIVGSLSSLQILNFSHNNLTGHIPSSLGNLAALESLDLSSNKLIGEIPMQLTGLKFLGVLNLSQNQLVGHIPQGNQFNTFLNDSYGGNLGLCGFPVSKTCGKEDTQEPPESVFHEEGVFSSPSDWKFVMMGYGCGLVLGLSAGYIILTIGKPEWLVRMVLSSVNSFVVLEGCSYTLMNEITRLYKKELVSMNLKVLDLGKNKFTGTFPNWLETLPMLQVLVLSSNKFHGVVNNSRARLLFPKLRVLDLANNDFVGPFPACYIENLKAMANHTDSRSSSKYVEGSRSYDYSVVLTIKGQEVELVKVLTIFTSIDLSNNYFQGVIPEVIGKLNSLIGLNLSHNNFFGHIPPSIGNLTNLEWLDLSSNKLIGKIPWELVNLTFLVILNLSKNQLVGSIPQGKQFNTFENSSYEGNVGLCGFPLSKACNEIGMQKPNKAMKESGIGFGWKVVLMGYGCGLIFGLTGGYLVFQTGKPKWIINLVEGKQLQKGKRSRKKKCL